MAEDASSLIAAARSDLERARVLIESEIRDYPAPIAGCDAQFNHLLSERKRVRAALAALEDVPFIATPRTPMPGAGIESR